MRTTLTVADDVLVAVKERARRENRTAGDVLSDLARQSLTAPAPTDDPETFLGFRPFARRGPTVSNDLVDQLRDDEPE